MKHAFTFFVFQLFCLVEFSHQRYIEDRDGPYRKPMPLMLHMDNIESPSFPLPNDEMQGGMHDAQNQPFALPNDEVQGRMHDTAKDDGPYRKPMPLMLHMDNIESHSSPPLPNDEVQGGIHDAQSQPFALPNDEVQGGMHDIQSQPFALPNDEVQGGMHDVQNQPFALPNDLFQGGMHDSQKGMQRDSWSK